MKKRILPIGFFSLLISGLTVLFLISSNPVKDSGDIGFASGDQSIIKAKEYLAMIRNNQHTGILDPQDVIAARKHVKEHSLYKSGMATDFGWIEMGPDNMGGRTRAIIFDKNDETNKTLYAAGVTGGIFKSTNLGAYWVKVNTPPDGTANLNVTSMVQADDGTIYAGTGEGFHSQYYTALGDLGYAGGFIGQGIFQSNSDDTFSLVPGTQPDENDNSSEWAYICELAISSDGKLWAATNTGLKVKESGSWVYAKAGSQEITGLACDVKTGSNGIVIATAEGKGYISVSGNPNEFVSFSTGEDNKLPVFGVGRIEFAIAPSDPDIIYAMAADSADGSLQNIYLSEDKGQNWRVVGPGGSGSFNVLGGQGFYNNTIVVFPNNPYKILAGGINLWEGTRIDSTGGFYQWSEKSFGINIFEPAYIHSDHHAYVFTPGNSNQFFIASDGGIFLGTIDNNGYTFQTRKINLTITQFYTIDISNNVKEVLAGSQDNGSIYINGESATPMKGEDIWKDFNGLISNGGDGGYCTMSNIRIEQVNERPPTIVYSKSPLTGANNIENRIRRSESLGFDYSFTFFDEVSMSSSSFLTPIALWESYNNQESRDSVDFEADKDYSAGETVVVRSYNYDHPFTYILPNSMNSGDVIRVKDIISTKLFIATKENIWMTFQSLNFDTIPVWYLISDSIHKDLKGTPQCMAYSFDANYLFVGTQDGRLYRISNIGLAYDYLRADVNSTSCIIATDQLQLIGGGNSQVITSIAVDPNDANKVLVTLGNYGNTENIYYTENALMDSPVFNSVQGNLAPMPVYSSILEMDASTDKAIIGTDLGIWATDDVSTGDWYDVTSSIGKVPVMALKQQSVYKSSFTTTYYDPGTGEPLYEIYPKIKNFGMIYAATHGRGIFRSEVFETVGVDEPKSISTEYQELRIYPNPATEKVNVSYNLNSNSDVNISIYNLAGKLVYSESLKSVNSGKHNTIINVNPLNKGTYLVRLVAGKDVRSSKLIIVN